MTPKVLVDDVVVYSGIGTDGVADEAMVSDVVADEGMVTNGMADVGVADEGIAGLGVEDLGVALVGVADGGVAGLGVEEFVADDGVGAQEFVVDAGEGTKEANVDAEVIVRTSVYKGKGIMLQEANPRRKRKYRPRGNGIVIEENANPSLTDDSDSDSNSETEIHFGIHNTNHTDDGCDYNMYSDSESEYSDRSVDYLSVGEEEVRKLRKRKSEAKTQPKRKNTPVNEQVAGSSRSNRLHKMGDTETILEHEEFMDDLLRKLRGDGCSTTDPFQIVETKVEKYPVHDEETHWRMRKPKVGENFVDGQQLKECLTYYALANGFSLWFYRSSTNQIIAKCGQRPEELKDPSKGKQRCFNKYPSGDKRNDNTCPWRCYGKLMVNESSFQIISMTDEHTCARSFKYGTLVNYKWIGKNFGSKIRINPDIKLHEIADMVMKKYKCIVSPHQCRNAKRWALNEGETTIAEHYALLRSYAKVILESNDGSTVKVGVTVNPNNKTYFDRFYVCFNGLKEGWKLGCRRVIALDGCFLKKPNVGEILTAIGRDCNNHIFPVAWAVVNVENKENWSWFLELLGEDLDLPTGNGLTLMSDQHKGLIEAVKDVMPNAEHRQCARHIYEGFRKQYSGVHFRGLFWAASKATYPELFRKIMEKMKRANPNAHQYLMNKDPKTWSRAFFRVGSNCEAIENGFSECFNSVLLRVRNKPLITMLEAMRVIVLERMNTMRHLWEAWTGDICLNIQKKLELAKDEQRFWHVIPVGGNLFEVRNGSEAFKVDESLRTCSCRLWQLSGIPCPHAVAVIFKLNKMAEEYLPDCFRKDMYIHAYNQYLTPVDGMSFWPDIGESSIILPPKPKSMPGRPRKKRIRASHEKSNSNRVSRAGTEMTCQNCGEKGQNKASCKKEKVVKPPKTPAKKGRPKKTSVEEPPLVDVSDILAFVNVADVEGSNAPEFVVENVGNVGGSSSVRVSVEDNVVHTKRERRVRFASVAEIVGSSGVGRSKLIQMRGGTCKRGQMIGGTGKRGRIGRKGFRRLGACFGLDDGGLNTSNYIQNSDPVEEPKTQQSQARTTPTTTRVERAASATITYGPSQAASAHQPRQEKRGRSEVPPVRPREKSQRILQKKLSRFNVQDVD